MPLKTCSCGHNFYSIPTNAKVTTCPVFGGYWFDCVCKSTMFIPAKKSEERGVA